jgi:hypothetical protein
MPKSLAHLIARLAPSSRSPRLSAVISPASASRCAVTHLLDRYAKDGRLPGPSQGQLGRAQALIASLEGQRREQVLDHQAVLDLGGLVQGADELLTGVDHNRRFSWPGCRRVQSSTDPDTDVHQVWNFRREGALSGSRGFILFHRPNAPAGARNLSSTHHLLGELNPTGSAVKVTFAQLSSGSVLRLPRHLGAVQGMPTAANAASTAATLRLSWSDGSVRNRVRALATTWRRLSANCDVRDSRCVSAR